MNKAHTPLDAGESRLGETLIHRKDVGAGGGGGLRFATGVLRLMSFRQKLRISQIKKARSGYFSQ